MGEREHPDAAIMHTPRLSLQERIAPLYSSREQLEQSMVEAGILSATDRAAITRLVENGRRDCLCIKNSDGTTEQAVLLSVVGGKVQVAIDDPLGYRLREIDVQTMIRWQEE